MVSRKNSFSLRWIKHLKPGTRSACYARGKVVLIQWDKNKERNEPSTTSSQRLLVSKWNPKGRHSEGAWRFDVRPKINYIKLVYYISYDRNTAC